MAKVIGLVSDDGQWLKQVEQRLDRERNDITSLAFEQVTFAREPLFADTVADKIKQWSVLRNEPYWGVILHAGHLWGISVKELVKVLSAEIPDLTVWCWPGTDVSQGQVDEVMRNEYKAKEGGRV